MIKSLMPKRFSENDVDFENQLKNLIEWSPASDKNTLFLVREIVDDVINRGDDALVEFTSKYDGLNIHSMNELLLDREQMKMHYDSIESSLRDALSESARRIKDFHEQQKQSSWQFEDEDGNLLGQNICPIDRAGIYVPGGKAAYPSSVLMNSIPAKVAGVNEIIMVSPAPYKAINSAVFAAAFIAGVDKAYLVGGAQAIAALAYGTESIKKVDVIVGPGNKYVACAKKMVFGDVGIDMIAGPSEILIICDGRTNPDWIAMDLFSQAEHDEDAQAILISDDMSFLNNVEESMNKLFSKMPRSEIIASSINNRSALIYVNKLESAVKLSNIISPEHLELSIENPEEMLPDIKNAGAIFLGRYTPEAIGDYSAGPNHVLPTSTSARFSSSLGVYNFQKRSSIIKCNENSVSKVGKLASILARSEGLEAHAKSAEMRYKILKN